MARQSKKPRRDQGQGIPPGTIPGAACNFYGALIRDAKIGPRRELNLQIETWPEGSHRFGGGPIVVIRFGAIFNFAEVEKFFAMPPSDSLHFVRHLEQSTARRHIVEIEFDRSEDRVRIIAGKLSAKIQG